MKAIKNAWEKRFQEVPERVMLWKYSLLQHLLSTTDFEQITGEVHLVQVIMDPAESLTDQQLHWRTHWRGKKGTGMIQEQGQMQRQRFKDSDQGKWQETEKREGSTDEEMGQCLFKNQCNLMLRVMHFF